MTTSIVLSDILSYSLQLTLVIGAGAALAVMFRIREPRVTLACWRMLLVVCLLLPLCQPWLTRAVPISEPSIAPQGIEVETQFSPAVAVAASTSSSITSLALLILCAGAAIRAVWLTTGAWTLARLRRTAQRVAPLPAVFCEAAARIGVQPGIYVSDRIAGPITFGWRRPVVIVPPSVLEMPLHVQEAIAYHELLHVRRRDWLFEVLEEAVRTAFWFHPAMWWLIGRIQLSREQVVDSAAVGLTDSKERYVDALLLVALNKSRVSLAPAPLFLRRSLLRQRVAQILQETTMTTRRLIASLTAQQRRTRRRGDRRRPLVPARSAGNSWLRTGVSGRANSDCQRRRSPAARFILGVSTPGNRAAGPGRRGPGPCDRRSRRGL